MDQNIEITTIQPDYYFWEDNRTWLNNSADNGTYDYDSENSTDYDPFQDMPQFLEDYYEFHVLIHGYLTLFVIIMGTVGNIISIIVLTRKNMINSINAILCALAVADMGVLLTYLTKIKYHSDLLIMFHTDVTYTLAVFCLYVRNSFIWFHTVSVWLTVVVAIWRVMGVCYSLSTTHLRSLSRAKIAIASTYIACLIICIPEYMRKEIDLDKEDITGNTYKPKYSEIYLANEEIFDIIDDYAFNLILYLLPCIPLTGFTVTLIRKLHRAKRKRKELEMRTAEQDKSNDRVTKMLIVILLVFLFTKVPPGIMYMLYYVFGYTWVNQLHWAFAGTINFLILLNSSVNFIVYFSMSTQFRASANAVFVKSITKKVHTIRLKHNKNQNYNVKKSFKKEMPKTDNQILNNEFKGENV